MVVIRILNLCRSSLRPWTQCERRTRPFAPQAESRQASDTLVTKVILGTFGCLPACDRYFIDGWKSEGFKYSYLNSKFVDRVLIFTGLAHDVRPVEIANPHLFKTKTMSGSPELQTATIAGESVGTAAPIHESPVSNAETPEATGPLAPDSAPAVVAAKKIVPISVFVSRKLSKLFVRQGFTPLFDVTVKIENPDEPLGTHVFTAMEFQNEGGTIRWTVVSIPAELPRMPKSATKESEAPATQTALPVALPDKANAALDRIEIPQDTFERISELLTPASSLIISDNALSHETGKDTDFIVVTH